jgi:hypothetical protein
MSRQLLLLVSRRDLVEATSGPEADRTLRALGSLTRRGVHFVATASQPEEWSRSQAESKRSKPGPKRLRDRLSDSGGVLDGVYYIPNSLLTQKARREDAIRDLSARFGIPTGDCFLFSSNRKFINTASGLGVNAERINENNPLCELLEDLEKQLD